MYNMIIRDKPISCLYVFIIIATLGFIVKSVPHFPDALPEP